VAWAIACAILFVHTSNYRIVLVDALHSTHSVAAYLRLLGHDVRQTADLKALPHLASKYRPDIVLFDPSMASSDVPGIVGTFTSTDAQPPPKLIALTSWGGKADRRRLQRAGFSAHLVQPVSLSALRKTLSAL
jgi:CheY-like chemotaxis protein